MGRIEEGAQTELAAPPWVLGWEETNPQGSFAGQTRESQLLCYCSRLVQKPGQGRWMLGTPVSPPPAREANVQLSQLSRGVSPDPGTRYRESWVEG